MITMAHYPPATSKWNKIEHQLFSFISINWMANSLIYLETVIEQIYYMAANKVLTVFDNNGSNIYHTGIKVTKQEMAALNLIRDPLHGD